MTVLLEAPPLWLDDKGRWHCLWCGKFVEKTTGHPECEQKPDE